MGSSISDLLHDWVKVGDTHRGVGNVTIHKRVGSRLPYETLRNASEKGLEDDKTRACVTYIARYAHVALIVALYFEIYNTKSSTYRCGTQKVSK